MRNVKRRLAVLLAAMIMVSSMPVMAEEAVVSDPGTAAGVQNVEEVSGETEIMPENTVPSEESGSGDEDLPEAETPEEDSGLEGSDSSGAELPDAGDDSEQEEDLVNGEANGESAAEDSDSPEEGEDPSQENGIVDEPETAEPETSESETSASEDKEGSLEEADEGDKESADAGEISEQDKETVIAGIIDALYAEVTDEILTTIIIKAEDMFEEMEQDESADDEEVLQSLIEKEVAEYLTAILESASDKEEFAGLEEEDIWQAVYDGLHEKLLSAIKAVYETARPEPASLLPLEEKTLTPDLTGLTPVELTMVPFSRVFEGEDMSGVSKVAYVYHYDGYEESNSYSDDYAIGSYEGNVNLSRGTCYGSSYEPWLMIPNGDQLDNEAKRYIVKPRYTASAEWLVPTIYVQDESGSRTVVEVSDYYYSDYGDTNYSRDMTVNVPYEQISNDKLIYLKFDVNSSLYGDFADRVTVKVYEGNYETAEAVDPEREITDKIYGNIDMEQKDNGYGIKSGFNECITIVTYDGDKVTGCLPVYLHVWGSSSGVSNYINARRIVRKNGSVWEGIDYGLHYYPSPGVTHEYELYDGYAVNDTYYFAMNYYQNGIQNNNAVTDVYVGQYTSIAEAEEDGAVNIAAELFGTDGYAADYSEGVHFSVFVGADGTEGQEVYHYCIKTKAGIVPKNSGVGVRFTGLLDKDGRRVECFIIKRKDDSYAEGSYPTIMIPNDVELTELAPEFYTDEGVKLYAVEDNKPEESGKNYKDFSKGAIHYTTGSEDEKNQKNVWLSVVHGVGTSGTKYKLYTNSLWDKESSDTRIVNGVTYSRREVLEDNHDIFLINMGDNVIPGLSAEINSDILEIDEYWTLNGNHDLAAFSGVADVTNYGDLANMAKVRLKRKDGVVSGSEVTGTLTIKAAGEVIMVLELVGAAGAPIIITDSILPEAVKYVPYGTMIQNSNKYSKTKVKYAFVNGALPDGMEVKENGEVYGVPKETGTFRFRVRMVSTDPYGNVTKEFTLVVKENTDANVDASTDPGYDVTERIPSVPLGSTGSHDFVSQGVLEEFKYVFLDGEKLIENVDYRKESGSTRLTISSETLARSNTPGTHTLGVEFRKSDEVLQKAAQNFTVVKAGSGSGNQGSGSGSGDDNSGNGGGDVSGGDSGNGGEDNSGGSASTDNSANETVVNTGGAGNASGSTAGNAANGAGNAANGAGNPGAAESLQDSEPVTYTVETGDTLWKIAVEYYGDGSLWTKIFADNKDVISNADIIRVGQQIKIYPRQADRPEGNAASGNGTGTATQNDGTYVIQPGDTLWKIARNRYGAGWRWRRIYDANRDVLSDPGVLQAGQVIVIP